MPRLLRSLALLLGLVAAFGCRAGEITVAAAAEYLDECPLPERVARLVLRA